MTSWRTSSYSTATGNCVEVAPAADGVLARHSKHPDAGTIAFPHPAWATFVQDAADGNTPGTNGVAAITGNGTGTVVRSLTDGTELHFDDGEWTAFLAGAADGEFTFTT
ncbi:DUF397 domain-containing protein [Pseudonocardia sp. HH130630-07]|uniref:DUF397 domain-containing protein n=1 Tax=Pseudonocardia sp. HH130630-07 TaxID=1690815 RepID=UPI000814F9F1|nr:DUF397 domain-containing protein [Pseudonocardia sp. HH130630-07]ANY06079.1 DUF397 domain-containing protein [Pseudonocardia sp. HH130630-07]